LQSGFGFKYTALIKGLFLWLTPELAGQVPDTGVYSIVYPAAIYVFISVANNIIIPSIRAGVTHIPVTLPSLRAQFDALTTYMDNLRDTLSNSINELTDSMVNQYITHGEYADTL
jgi:hypothetical protein